MQSRNYQHVRHAGERETLPDVLIDSAAIADYQRSHRGVLRICEIRIDECADPVAHRLDSLAYWVLAMADHHNCGCRARHRCIRGPVRPALAHPRTSALRSRCAAAIRDSRTPLDRRHYAET